MIDFKKVADSICPLDRAIVSDGYDKAINYLADVIPLNIHKIPSDTEIWTWVVPDKWRVRDAYFTDGKKKFADYKEHPLHLVSFSVPFKGRVSREELLQHINTNPKYANDIPFVYKYNERDWGFCMPHNQLADLTEDSYNVYIDTDFVKGYLKVGEYIKQGKSDECFVFMAHLCHPGQFNDGLSGVLASVNVADYLERIETYYTYRILFFPETVGSTAYLSQNEHLIPSMKGAISSEMLAVDQMISVQHSYDSSAYINHVVCKVLDDLSIEYRARDYLKVLRNDEKIFDAPGVMIPSVSITRSKLPGEDGFPIHGYHTSYDNVDNADFGKFDEICNILIKVVNYLEDDFVPQRRFKGQVMLSRYDLFVDPAVDREKYNKLEELMWHLEGDKSILEIARILDLDFYWLREYLDQYCRNNLVTLSRKVL